MHRTTAELLAGLPAVEASPRDIGTLDLIVARPSAGERALPTMAELCIERGLVGDGWLARGSRHTPDGAAEPDRQLTLVATRALASSPMTAAVWPLAGDQLVVDLALGPDDLPAGTRLAIGSAEIEVTAAPHTGCAKFRDRFGTDAARFVNSPDGLRLRLRGINARVVTSGHVRVGDEVRKALVPVS